MDRRMFFGAVASLFLRPHQRKHKFILHCSRTLSYRAGRLDTLGRLNRKGWLFEEYIAWRRRSRPRCPTDDYWNKNRSRMWSNHMANIRNGLSEPLSK